MGDYSDLYPRVRLLFYDIETAPMLAWAWQQKTDYIPDHMVENDDRFLLCWAAKWSDSTEILSAGLTSTEAKSQDDGRIVDRLAQLIRQADYVIAHNGNRFDLRRVNARILINKLEPLGHVQQIDTLLIARQSFDLPSNKLNALSKKLGFGEKLATDFDLWRRAYFGDGKALKQLRAYNAQDVVLLEHVFHALVPYAKRLPRLVDVAEWRDERCPYCGSQDRTSSGVYRTGVNNYPKYRCGACRREFRGWQAIGSRKAGSVGL